MATRGIYGFRINETDKLAYNHADSYPNQLGTNLLSELHSVEDWAAVEERIRTLASVHESRKIGLNDEIFRTELRRHYSGLAYRGQPADFYDLMQPLQGKLEPFLSGKLSFMATANEFIDNSLFCEWGYIVDLDQNQFQIYRGQQLNAPEKESPYFENGPDRMGYFPCHQIHSYGLESLPTVEQFQEDTKRWK